MIIPLVCVLLSDVNIKNLFVISSSHVKKHPRFIADIFLKVVFLLCWKLNHSVLVCVFLSYLKIMFFSSYFNLLSLILSKQYSCFRIGNCMHHDGILSLRGSIRYFRHFCTNLPSFVSSVLLLPLSLIVLRYFLISYQIFVCWNISCYFQEEIQCYICN